MSTEHSPNGGIPLFDEVGALLQRAEADGATQSEIERRLQRGLRNKIESIISIMRMSARQNPELQKLFLALSDDSIDACQVAHSISDFPIAQEAAQALELGLVHSSHSTVRASTITRYLEEIDRCQIRQCQH